jgi:hypothetical protein
VKLNSNKKSIFFDGKAELKEGYEWSLDNIEWKFIYDKEASKKKGKLVLHEGALETNEPIDENKPPLKKEYMIDNNEIKLKPIYSKQKDKIVYHEGLLLDENHEPIIENYYGIYSLYMLKPGYIGECRWRDNGQITGDPILWGPKYEKINDPKSPYGYTIKIKKGYIQREGGEWIEESTNPNACMKESNSAISKVLEGIALLSVIGYCGYNIFLKYKNENLTNKKNISKAHITEKPEEKKNVEKQNISKTHITEKKEEKNKSQPCL